MIIKVLMENTTQNPAFQTEHGLSLYIETDHQKMLFDTGQSPAFIQNANAMQVDLAAVDFAVLSHAHYDHSGGMLAFLAQNTHAPVYVSQHVFDHYTNSAGNYIGPDKALMDHPQLKCIQNDTLLTPQIQLFTGEGFPYKQPIQSYGLNVSRNGGTEPDDFRHEQYLMITENHKQVLFSGCSHRGIINIASWFTPDFLIGGFHFMKLDPQGEGKAALDNAANALKQHNTQYYTCHCTGTSQYEYMKEQMQDQLHYLSCGQEIVL